MQSDLSAVTAYTRWQPNLLAGLGRMREMQQYSVIAQMSYLIVACILLLGGTGLIGVALAQLVQITVGRFLFTAALRRALPGRSVWSSAQLRETIATLWPMAWRQGSMALAGSAGGAINTLLIANVVGLSAAASFGLCMQVLSLVGNVSGILLSVKTSDLTRLQAQVDPARLRDLVLPRLGAGLLLFVAGCAVTVAVGSDLFRLIGSQTPLLAMPVLLLLCAERFLQFNQDQCVRIVLSGNCIPFLAGYLLSTSVLPVAAWIGARQLGVVGLICANIAIQSVYNNRKALKFAASALELTPIKLYGRSLASLWNQAHQSRPR